MSEGGGVPVPGFVDPECPIDSDIPGQIENLRPESVVDTLSRIGMESLTSQGLSDPDSLPTLTLDTPTPKIASPREDDDTITADNVQSAPISDSLSSKMESLRSQTLANQLQTHLTRALTQVANNVFSFLNFVQVNGKLEFNVDNDEVRNTLHDHI